MDIRDIIQESYMLNRQLVSDDTIKALDNISKYTDIPYLDYVFKSDEEFNGWIVPKKWSVKKANIIYNNRIVYDGTVHPLAVYAYSSSFNGIILKQKLEKHIHTDLNNPDAIPFYFRLTYRPWESEWGFCMPQKEFEKFEDGEYKIELETSLESGEMICREFTLRGLSNQCIIFVAHIDHPGMANDDLSGCAVGIQLLNEIKNKFDNRRYTYKLLLVPEIIGSNFYLQELIKSDEVKNIKYGIFLESLGGKQNLNLQKSFNGNTLVDSICEIAIKKLYEKPKIYNFRENIGNDETSFEAPGIEIPMVSISRHPYPEYHTSDDNINIIFEESLKQSLEYFINVVYIIENNYFVKRKFNGLICLSNPKYNLYIDFNKDMKYNKEECYKYLNFQNKILRYLDGNYSIVDICDEFDVEFEWLNEYLNEMYKKNLIEKIYK